VRCWTGAASVLKTGRILPAPIKPEVRLTASFAATTESNATVRGLAAVAAATFCYGSITPLAPIAYDDGATPLTIVALRSAVFALAIGAYLAYRGTGINLPRRAWFATVIFAGFMVVWAYSYMASVAYIPVSLAVLVFFTFPLLVAVFASVTGHDRMTILKAAALLIAFAGLALALGPSWGALDWRGVAFALGASVIGATAYIFVTPIFRNYDLMQVSFLTHVWMTLAALAYGLLARDFALPRTMEGQWPVLAVVILYVGAFSFWALAMPLIGPVRTAGMMNLEPVISIALAALILGERLTWVQLGGAVLVLLALVLIARGPQAGRRLEEAT
jgi:drug/metabolite transporter (DMT)-like permease